MNPATLCDLCKHGKRESHRSDLDRRCPRLDLQGQWARGDRTERDLFDFFARELDRLFEEAHP
jgi:hypothetical protein